MTEALTAPPTDRECKLALLSHALSFIEGGVVAPLLMYLFRKELHQALYKDQPGADSPFVAFHSLQSLYFGLLFLGVTLPVALLTCGWGIVLTVPLYLIFEVIACIRANEGEWYRLPFAGDWAATRHPPPPGA